MLALPTRGFSRSINAHNIRLDTLTDWIEASVVFDMQTLSKSELIDVLIDNHLFISSDMASERVSDAWLELKKRASWLDKAAPFEVVARRIRRTKGWKSAPALSFCLLVSYAYWNSSWKVGNGTDYAEQGAVFEELTKESVETIFVGWNVHMTGWSRARVQALSSVVQGVAYVLGEAVANVQRWTVRNAKDAGLDLLFYRTFNDDKVGFPVYLVQCASGANWKDKLNTPDINVWRHLVDFSAMPKRAFATPLALPREDFHQHCTRVDGPILDRYRLLSAGSLKANWLTTELKRRVIDWVAPRVEDLPRL